MSDLKNKKSIPRVWYTDFNVAKPSFLSKIKNNFLFGLYFWTGICFLDKTRGFDFSHRKSEDFIKFLDVKIRHIHEQRFFTMYVPSSISSAFSSNITFNQQVFIAHPSLFKGNFLENQKYYYYTVCHELIHWAGNEFNLNRFNFDKLVANMKNPEEYAFEEMIAGLGSEILMEELDLHDEDIKLRANCYVMDYLIAIVRINLKSGKIPIIHDTNVLIDDISFAELNCYIKECDYTRDILRQATYKAVESVNFLKNLSKYNQYIFEKRAQN